MQEGIISLMQMAKTSAAIKRHSEAGLALYPGADRPDLQEELPPALPCVGDIILAEPGALIGFCRSQELLPRPLARNCRKGSRDQSSWWNMVSLTVLSAGRIPEADAVRPGEASSEE